MKSGDTKAEPGVRQRLLAASVELFTSKGYAATSVREIVSAAGVTKPVLYYYFGSKEGIYLELMQNTFLQFEEILASISALPGTARERIIRFGTGMFDAFIENIGVARLIYSIFFGPPQGAPHFPQDKYFDLMLTTIRELVSEGVAAGEFRPVEEEPASWALLSSMNTIMEEQICSTPPRIDRSGLIQTMTLILDGMTSGETR